MPILDKNHKAAFFRGVYLLSDREGRGGCSMFSGKKTTIINLVITVCFLFSVSCFTAPLLAQEENGAATGDVMEDYNSRIDLARKINEVYPVSIQVRNVLEYFSRNSSQTEMDEFVADVMKNIDMQGLEVLSVTTMAQMFSIFELQVMFDYYKTPESISIAGKTLRYRQIMDPQIKDSVLLALSRMRVGFLPPEQRRLASENMPK